MVGKDTLCIPKKKKSGPSNFCAILHKVVLKDLQEIIWPGSQNQSERFL